MGKHCKISDKTIILLNKARAKMLNKSPKKNYTDDEVIYEALKKY